MLVNYLRIWLQQRGAGGIGLYAPTMFLMAGLLVIGLLCNLAVRPVAACHFRHGATPAAGATGKSPVAISKMKLAAYWLAVGIPLGWGIWKTLMKLPALVR